MLRSAMIATALLAAVTAPAAADFSKTKVTKIDGFGNRVSSTSISGTNAFGQSVNARRVVIDPAGPGNKIIATKITRNSPFGGSVTVTKVRKVSDFGF